MAIQTFPVTQDCRPLLTGLGIIHALTLLAFGLRFVSRWLTKLRLGVDDILTIVAILSSTAAFALFNMGLQSGYGYSFLEEEFDANRVFNLQIWAAIDCLYALSIACARLAALFLYLRVFSESRKFRIITIVFMALITLLVVVFAIAETVAFLLQLPVLYGIANVAACVVAMLSDIIVLFLPMPLLFNLKMRISKRLGLHLLCLFGLSTVCVAFWRLVLFFTLDDGEGSYNYPPRQMFTKILEADLVILFTGIPLIYSIFTRNRSDRFENKMLQSTDSFTNVASYARLLDPIPPPPGGVHNQETQYR